MMFTKSTLATLAMAGAAIAQNMSICDKYTTALLKENTPANQEALLTLLVNTAVLGNATEKDGKIVTGILNPGEYEGYKVNLIGFFNGGLASTNREDKPVAVNFLDGGGAEPLNMGMASNNTESNQYKLLTHLYSYFGVLLGCTGVGKDGFEAYEGVNSQYDVHKYMGLDQNQNGYFISQVAASAAYYGVSEEDISTVGAALTKLFNYRCSPATEVIPGSGAEMQSICQAESCPLDPMGNCSQAGYMNATRPQAVNQTLAGNSTEVVNSQGENVATAIPSNTMEVESSATGMATSTSAGPSSSPTRAAALALKVGESGLGMVLGAVAFALAL